MSASTEDQSIVESDKAKAFLGPWRYQLLTFKLVQVLATIFLSNFYVILSFNVDRGELWLLFFDFAFV